MIIVQYHGNCRKSYQLPVFEGFSRCYKLTLRFLNTAFCTMDIILSSVGLSHLFRHRHLNLKIRPAFLAGRWQQKLKKSGLMMETFRRFLRTWDVEWIASEFEVSQDLYFFYWCVGNGENLLFGKHHWNARKLLNFMLTSQTVFFFFRLTGGNVLLQSLSVNRADWNRFPSDWRKKLIEKQAKIKRRHSSSPSKNWRTYPINLVWIRLKRYIWAVVPSAAGSAKHSKRCTWTKVCLEHVFGSYGRCPGYFFGSYLSTVRYFVWYSWVSIWFWLLFDLI